MKKKKSSSKRCSWAEVSDLDRDYHDNEWGLPIYEDHQLFEMLTLEGAQAGLSWRTILAKREGYRRLFAEFDPKKVSLFTGNRVKKILQDASIVRHLGKIESTVSNAKAVVKLQKKFGSFSSFIWDFVDGKPVQNRYIEMDDVPAETPISKAMSKELKRHEFRFVGPTTCYAFMQAAGLVNDHLISCPRHAICLEASKY